MCRHPHAAGRPARRYAEDDREHGDGVQFFRFSEGSTAALFIRFATQSTQV